MTRGPTVRIGLVAATIVATLLLSGCAALFATGFTLQCEAAGGSPDFEIVKGVPTASCIFPDGRVIYLDLDDPEDQVVLDPPLAPLPDPDEDSTLSENGS